MLLGSPLQLIWDPINSYAFFLYLLLNSFIWGLGLSFTVYLIKKKWRSKCQSLNYAL
jgi:hypothetical protein